MRPTLIEKGIPVVFAVLGMAALAGWLVAYSRGPQITPRKFELDRRPVPTRPAGRSFAGPSSLPGLASAGTLSAGPAVSSAPVATRANTSLLPLAGEWPAFRGPNGDNISPETVPLARQWAGGAPPLLWTVNLGEGYAAAAVHKGRVYVLDYDQGAQADALRCFSLADGSELWRYSYPDAVKRNHGMSRTIPTVTDKYVVTLGPKCMVLCTNPTTGKPIWSHDLVAEFGTTVPQWYAGQCPLVDKGRVIVAPGGTALMVAFDVATGKVAWQTPNPDTWEMTHSSVVPVTVGGRRQYIYCASGGVVGVDAATGAALWKTPEWTNSFATVPSPVPLGGGRILLAGGYNAGAMLLQLDQQGPNIVPRILLRMPPPVCSAEQQTPILYKGRIYTVLQGGQLACLDTNGKQLWSSGPAHRFGIGPYVIADGLLYLLDDYGMLTVVDPSPAGYRQLAQARIIADGSDCWGPLAVAGGRLIARDLTRMVCLDIARH